LKEKRRERKEKRREGGVRKGEDYRRERKTGEKKNILKMWNKAIRAMKETS
jgi:hypothetical protein